VRALEFFAGIGGLSAACPWLDIQAALDIDQTAKCVYERNFARPYRCCELATISAETLASYPAELWWMSPPCTPFTKKGNRKDDEDPRTIALMNLIQIALEIKPELVVIENVIGFETSKTCQRVITLLEDVGYTHCICKRCPRKLGWPNRRERVYLVLTYKPADRRWADRLAGESANIPTVAIPIGARRLVDLLDPSITRDNYPELWLGEWEYKRYQSAIDRLDPSDPDAMAACFASSYGKMIVRGGSYLWQDGGYRRFSPREVANVLGFSADFILPGELSDRRLWHLLGNSLSLPAVRHLMQFTAPSNSK
jgi:site-specific DNA-cytosine methylase